MGGPLPRSCAAAGAGREPDCAAGDEPLGAARAAERRPARQHDQPLLVPVLEVVGADALPRRKLVERAADQPGADPASEPGEAGAIPLWIGRFLGRLRLEEVEPRHTGSISGLGPARTAYQLVWACASLSLAGPPCCSSAARAPARRRRAGRPIRRGRLPSLPFASPPRRVASSPAAARSSGALACRSCARRSCR